MRRIPGIIVETGNITNLGYNRTSNRVDLGDLLQNQTNSEGKCKDETPRMPVEQQKKKRSKSLTWAEPNECPPILPHTIVVTVAPVNAPLQHLRLLFFFLFLQHFQHTPQCPSSSPGPYPGLSCGPTGPSRVLPARLLSPAASPVPWPRLRRLRPRGPTGPGKRSLRFTTPP